MTQQVEDNRFILHIDNQLYRLKKDPKISFKEISQLINHQLKTTFTAIDLKNRWETLQKSSKEVTIAVFNEFKRCQIDLVRISERTGVALMRVKREIMGGLVNNIWKVCFIVRKRSISFLKSNFISTNNIKILVLNILKPNNLRSVKQEYSLLWNFISQYYEQTHFKTISDQMYKLVYRELIILAEKFKINEIFDESELQFQRKILEQSVVNNRQNELFALLNDFKRKENKEMIDLISEDEEQEKNSADQLIEEDIGHSMQEEVQPNIYNQFMQELINAYHQLTQLTQTNEDQCVLQQISRILVKICYIQDILKSQ